MSIVGEELDKYVIKQINARQTLHGSGKSTTRNNNQLKILNSQNSWIKVASGVSISPDKAKELGYPKLSGTELAKKYVLFNGTSTFSKDGESLAQRGKFLPGTYERSDFGIVPMPGVESLDVKTLTRGSLKKATLKFKVHSRKQFEIIDVLYLRLGYTLLVEWGNNTYTKNGTDLHAVKNTLLEDSFFKTGDQGLESNADYAKALNNIQAKRREYVGNYDGFLAKISNFEWVFNDDGSYSITLTLMSLGDVIESLKSNISVSPQFVKFQNYTNTKEEGTQTEEIENRSKSQLHAFLWCWEWLNTHGKRETYDEHEFVYTGNSSEPKRRVVGYFLKTGDENLTVSRYETYYDMSYSYYNPPAYKRSETFSYTPEEWGSSQPWKDKRNAMWHHIQDTLLRRGYSSDRAECAGEADDDLDSSYTSYVKNTSEISTTTINPIPSFIRSKDGFRTPHSNKGKDSADIYIRFGALLEYIEQKIIPRVNSSGKSLNNLSQSDSTNQSNFNKLNPLFKIDINNSINSNSIMYTIPNQFSCDLRVCCVRNYFINPTDYENSEGVQLYRSQGSFFFGELEPFRTLDYDTPPGNQKKFKHVNRAQALNIYLNFKFVREVLDSNTDKDGSVSVFNLIKGICEGVNTAMGGINNLEPIINEFTNTLSIIDTTPIPGRVKSYSKLSDKYKLNLFGYNGNTSNFVRKLNIKTAITPKYATMITVGATAGGSIKGVDATSFSKWNKGIEDKFKPEIISGDIESVTFPAESVSNYTEKFLKERTKGILCTTKNTPFDSFKWKEPLDDSVIDQNLSIVSEFFKYAIARKNQLSEGKSVSGGIGFIPFKVNISVDGISGVKIYNVLRMDSSFLPSVYGDALNFIVTGISHKLSNNDWETDIEVTVMPKSDILGGKIDNYNYLWTEEVKTSLFGNYKSFTEILFSPSTSNVSSGGGTGDGKGTLGTGATTEFAKNAYTDKTKLDIGIKAGLDKLNTL